MRRRFRDPVNSVRFVRAENAAPAPGVVEAILSAEMILLAPSNPVTSIGPILAVADIRKALRETEAPIGAVSPIVGEAAVSGPAGALMAAHRLPVSIAGVAEAYEDFLDFLVVDSADEEAAQKLRSSKFDALCTNTIMKTTQDRIELARAVHSFASNSKKLKVAS